MEIKNMKEENKKTKVRNVTVDIVRDLESVVRQVEDALQSELL
jgi:hypothetical protein